MLFYRFSDIDSAETHHTETLYITVVYWLTTTAILFIVMLPCLFSQLQYLQTVYVRCLAVLFTLTHTVLGQ